MLAMALGLGLVASFAAPACLLNDYCIVLQVRGTDWCVRVEDALAWPAGQPELAERVKAESGGSPVGCRCMNDGEFAILQHEVPEAYYAELVEEIEEAARYACATAVPPGYDHNCFVLDEDNGPNFTSPYADTKHTSPDCIGWCGDVNDPPFGSCGPDPDPWACNEDGSGETGDAVETTEGDDPDSPPGGAADRRLAW